MNNNNIKLKPDPQYLAVCTPAATTSHVCFNNASAFYTNDDILNVLINNKFKAQTLTGNPTGNLRCHVSRTLNMPCIFGQSVRSIEIKCVVTPMSSIQRLESVCSQHCSLRTLLFSTTNKLNKTCINGKGQQIGIYTNIQRHYYTNILCKDTGNGMILCQLTKFAWYVCCWWKYIKANHDAIMELTFS